VEDIFVEIEEYITSNISEKPLCTAPPDIIGKIIDLSNTFLVVGIPAIVGLITAAASFVKSQSNSKKVDNAMDIGINGGKAAITFGQKITEHINEFVPFFNAVYEMLLIKRKN
jgi:hypothetical protein